MAGVFYSLDIGLKSFVGLVNWVGKGGRRSKFLPGFHRHDQGSFTESRNFQCRFGTPTSPPSFRREQRPAW